MRSARGRLEHQCREAFPDCPCNTCVWDKFIEQLPNGRTRITPCCEGRPCVGGAPCPNYLKEHEEENAMTAAEGRESEYDEAC